MMSTNKFHLSLCLIVHVFLLANSEKYRVCVVDGKGLYKRSLKYCPKLDETISKVECIAASDRFDCLRKIHKRNADFGVFTPEDLVAAVNADIDLAITNELRFVKDSEFAYELVAVISNSAKIKSRHDVKNKRYCHPGYGFEYDSTKIESNYFESTIVTPQCNSNLTIIENRIKASSDFFKAACKAGPWVYDTEFDRYLKLKYSNLCELCNDRCTVDDKYWGRQGSLLCLTDGAGDISWARLSDVQQHFGVTSSLAEANPNDYSLLCPDDTIISINSTNPCVWMAKPWPVVASKMGTASAIEYLIGKLNYDSNAQWQSSLLSLLETSSLNIKILNSTESIGRYLHKAKGFLNTHSFSSCHPPRTIRICTTSIIETAKCSWLREAAAVYGIEPDVDCLKADNETHCMMAINDNAADIVIISPDLLHKAKNTFKLKTLFYETVKNSDNYIVVAVTREGSNLKKLKDFIGVKACFPSYDGVAWNTVIQKIRKNNLNAEACSLNSGLETFFGPSCVPDVYVNDLKKRCSHDSANDYGALQRLANGVCDVAFVSKNSLIKFESSALHPKLTVLCLEEKQELCHLSWAPAGQAMVNGNHTNVWMKDTLNVFMQLDAIFGKNSKDPTRPFTLFGRYDGMPNILFHDSTEKLRETPSLKNTGKMDLFYGDILKNETICSSGNIIKFNFKFFMTGLILSIKIYQIPNVIL